jgi:hypothetical protein
MLVGLASAREEINSASSLSAGGVCKYWEIYLQIVQLVIISIVENKRLSRKMGLIWALFRVKIGSVGWI